MMVKKKELEKRRMGEGEIIKIPSLEGLGVGMN
jgi:hypothetical protein